MLLPRVQQDGAYHTLPVVTSSNMHLRKQTFLLLLSGGYPRKNKVIIMNMKGKIFLCSNISNFK